MRRCLRYNRQIILRNFDFDGQERLKGARVLVVGLGGLGCAAASIWRRPASARLPCSISIASRSPIYSARRWHSDATIGLPKVDSARDSLARINPHVRLTPLNALLDQPALAAQIAAHDLVLDLYR
nr:Molybdopterin biosynthesis protein MoeB [Raoultella sp. NCTC 9187]